MLFLMIRHQFSRILVKVVFQKPYNSCSNKNCKIHRKTPAMASLVCKVTGLDFNVTEKRRLRRCLLSCELFEILQNTFSQNITERLHISLLASMIASQALSFLSFSANNKSKFFLRSNFLKCVIVQFFSISLHLGFFLI